MATAAGSLCLQGSCASTAMMLGAPTLPCSLRDPAQQVCEQLATRKLNVSGYCVRTSQFHGPSGALLLTRTCLAPSPLLLRACVEIPCPRTNSSLSLPRTQSIAAQQPPLPAVVLIGDAAHGVTPVTGSGMNSALEDAWLLGQVGESPSVAPLEAPFISLLLQGCLTH